MTAKSVRDVTLNQLRYYVQAAEMSSMTKAAQHLYVAQSAVSSAISQLERELGTRLFIRRRSKGIVLTESGEQLLISARNILDELSVSLEEVAGGAQVTRGILHASCYTPLVPFYIPDILASFNREYPEVQLLLTENYLPDVDASIRSGRTEIAVVYDLGFSETVARETLKSIYPYAVVAEDHPLAGQAGVSLEELVDYPMVLLDLPHSREYFMKCFIARGLSPEIQFRTTNYEAVRSLVSGSSSFALMHQRPEVDVTYAGRNIVALDLRDEVEPLRVALATLKGNSVSARSRAFAEEARNVISDVRVDVTRRNWH